MLGLWPFAGPLAVVRVRPSRKTKRLRDLSSKNCSWTENVFCVSKSWHDRRPECKYTNFAIAKFFPDADSRNSRAQASSASPPGTRPDHKNDNVVAERCAMLMRRADHVRFLTETCAQMKEFVATADVPAKVRREVRAVLAEISLEAAEADAILRDEPRAIRKRNTG
jgi:hypothetical protein